MKIQPIKNQSTKLQFNPSLTQKKILLKSQTEGQEFTRITILGFKNFRIKIQQKHFNFEISGNWKLPKNNSFENFPKSYIIERQREQIRKNLLFTLFLSFQFVQVGALLFTFQDNYLELVKSYTLTKMFIEIWQLLRNLSYSCDQ
jgi:hypothetical protein